VHLGGVIGVAECSRGPVDLIGPLIVREALCVRSRHREPNSRLTPSRVDADAITEFAHFGPTGMSTEDGEPMITVVSTTQDRDDLAAALEEAGWMAAGENTFESDAPFRDVASANWVYIGDGVVIWAPHSRHLDVALDVGVETSTDLPIIEALARAEGNRRVSIALNRPSECGRVLAAGDDAGGGARSFSPSATLRKTSESRSTRTRTSIADAVWSTRSSTPSRTATSWSRPQ